MSEWKEYKFGEIADIVKDKYSPKKGDALNYIGLEHIQEQTLRLNGIGCSDDVISDKFMFKKGDILFGKLRPYFRKVIRPKFDGVCSTDIWVIRAKQGISQEFLFYLIASKEFVDICSYGEAGTRMPRADWEFVNQTVWNIPVDQSEQCAIASVLSSLDDKIDLLHRENKTLEAMAETLFRQWFIEEAKDEWEAAKLGDVVTITYGKNLPTKKLLKSGYPVFGGNGQIGFYDEYLYKEPQVLVSCRGEASGKVNISLPMSFVTNNSLVLERNKRKEITFEYLKYYSLNYDFTIHITGSAQPQITIDSLYDATFIIPPISLINSFSEIVRSYEEKLANNLKQIRTLEKLRDTLLPKLISGEVRVKYEEEEMASCRA